MSEDIRKILEDKEKIYQRVIDLLEKKATEVKHGGNKPTQTKKNEITLEQAMRESFNRIRNCYR